MKEFLVVDIETYPLEDSDTRIIPFVESLRGKFKRTYEVEKPKSLAELSGRATAKPDKSQLAFGKAALSPISGQIACIGVLKYKEKEFNTDEESTTDWFYIISKSEKEMLETFAKMIKPQTIFVTFNGRAFDFPFLMFRAAICGVPLSLDIYPYNSGKRHIDMMVHLGSLANIKAFDSTLMYPPSLKKWQKYFCWQEKKSIKDGDISIEQCVKNEEWGTLEEYVQGDVVTTFKLFQFFRGNFSMDGYGNY